MTRKNFRKSKMSRACKTGTLARFVRDRRGVSAIEFAMLLPLMVTLFLGGVEISQAVAIDRKVTLTTRTVADLTTQVSSIKNSDMTNILNASTAVMSPYATGTLKITISCLTIDSTGKATVTWSDTRNGTARAVGSTVTLPSALAVPSTTLVFSEVSYGYTPTIGKFITGTLSLADLLYMRPRISDTISRTAT
jgi:Flp pilus assembly protein TadG